MKDFEFFTGLAFGAIAVFAYCETNNTTKNSSSTGTINTLHYAKGNNSCQNHKNQAQQNKLVFPVVLELLSEENSCNFLNMDYYGIYEPII